MGPLRYIFIFVIFPMFIVNATAQRSQQNLEEAFALSYEKEAENNYSQSIDALKQVYDKESYEINLRLGWLYYNSGQFETSVRYYSIAQQLKPYSEEARLGLVKPISALGKWDDVISLYNEILNIHPNNTAVLYKLGIIYYQRKSYTKAHHLFKKMVDLYPFNYDGLLMLAWTSYFQGNYNQAEVLFHKVKLNSPDDESATEGLNLLGR